MTLKIDNFVKQFTEYTEQYGDSEPIKLKIEHSFRVLEFAQQISEFVLPIEKYRILSEIAALYHDIGRFEQYKIYNTFVDANSENHSLIGLKVIRDKNFFQIIEPEYIKIIEFAIENHNKRKIENSYSDIAYTIATIVRDADKIDILNTFAMYYNGNIKDEVIEQNKPDLKEYNPKVIDDILSGQMVDMKDVRTLNDFKLLKLSWVFDLNYAISYKIVKKGCYLQNIYNTLTVKDSLTQNVFNIIEGICEAYEN